MKIQNRSKSNTRSITPTQILSQKPPFPKLIQKKARVMRPSLIQNKENFPLNMVIPEDSLLIKPNDTLKSLYVQSPVGDIHFSLPYELAQTNPITKKPEHVPRSLGFSLNSSENPLNISEIPFFTEEIPVKTHALKSDPGPEASPIKQAMPRKYSKLPPKFVMSRNRKETPKVTKIEISVNSSCDTPFNLSQGSASSGSGGRNTRVKLLSKNFKITRNTLTKYCASSLNSTPEPGVSNINGC